MENKNSFFSIEIQIPSVLIQTPKEKELLDGIDLVLSAMNASPKECNIVKKNDGTKIVVIFKSLTRKRKGQLNKFCQRFIPAGFDFETESLDRYNVIKAVESVKQDTQFTVMNESKDEIYSGDDIKIFEDRKNWHEWQVDIFNMIYEESGEIKKPDPRGIISLIDYAGNSGKSSFFKFMYVKDLQQNIGRATYGSASQLRSSLIQQGKKKIYIIDLARTKSSNDKQDDILSVIEDCKSGFIISPMYGRCDALIMEPPHVILASNYLFNTESLSKDRWNIYEIKSNKKLGKKNELLTIKEVKESEKTEYSSSLKK